MNESSTKFIQANSPDGGFLQSEEWRKFQEVYGLRTFNLAYRQAGISSDGFWANIIEHKLKIVGRYFYVPRGPIASLDSEEFPISNFQFPIKSKIQNSKFSNSFSKIIGLAKKENAGWIRIEPASEELLQEIRQSTRHKIVKAPHDMQPKEIFVIDITRPEEQLLAEMKAKTRYNIKLAEKREVSLRITNKYECTNNDFEEFLRLVKVTAERNKISAHPEEYYRKMWETLSSEMLKLYVAEYQGKIIAANLVLFFGKFATYLHGASDNEYREVMAPYLLQWHAIKDAKEKGCERYDFGGVSANIRITNKFYGITKFKLGFAPGTKPIEFPGAYDIIINSRKYYIYRALQFIKSIF